MTSPFLDDWMELADVGHNVYRCLDLAEWDLLYIKSSIVNQANFMQLSAEIDLTINERVENYCHIPWAIDAADELKRRLKSILRQQINLWLQ